MKAIKLFTLIGAAVAITFTSSCSKDKSMLKPTTKFNYDNKDLKTVIKLGNPILYEKMFVQKDIIDRTIFVIKGVNDGYGNCDDGDCICTVIVITTYPGLTANDSININSNTPDITLNFLAKGDADLILANPEVPESVDPAHINITTNKDGTKRIKYVSF